MARIERERNIDSTLINKEFLRKLIYLMEKINPQGLKLNIEISVYSDGEKTTFNDLDDFLETSVGLDTPNSFLLRIYPAEKKNRHKIVQLYVKIDTKEESRNYYQLAGYDEGKLLECEKKINNLFNEYKSWYFFMFKIPMVKEGIPSLIAAISLGILTHFLLGKFFMSIDNWRGLISLILFFVYAKYLAVWENKLLPRMNLDFGRTKRSKFWRAAFAAILLGLIVNLIGWIINYLINLNS